ncbi:MAG: TIGR02996 domain-containing protein [Myxococcota bacterium]
MKSEGDELLARLAEHPFDRALRLVYADWLLDQGDPRGEVIALSMKEDLSLTQRRRVQRLTEQHAAAWLGPLVTVADIGACRWEGGFLDVLAVGAPTPGSWPGVVGDPRLATVRGLLFSVLSDPLPVAPFLAHPVLRHVSHLQVGVALLEAVARAPLAFVPRSLALISWGTFGRELSSLAGAEALKRTPRIELITSEFINAIVAGEVRSAVLEHRLGLRHFEEIRLVARFGVLEGAAAWLLRGNDARRVETELPQLTRWGVDYGDVHFTLARAADRFDRLEVDLSGPDRSLGLGARLALAASVVPLLAPARLSEVDVRLPPGARISQSERDTLRTAVRRLGTVGTFHLGDASALP